MAVFKSSDGVQLWYDVRGDGFPLLLHLGAGCDSALWDAAGYLTPLAQSYECILFDHRGHGQSDHPLGPQANHVDRYVDDVRALLRVLGLERIAFWGYSNGGVVGLKLADESPAAVAALVVSGTIANATDEQVRQIAPARAAEHREYGWERLIAGFEDEEPVPEWMTRRIRATDVEPYIGWWEARPDWHWDPWDAFSRVVTPTLFVVGELEDPDDTMEVAAQHMQRGTRERVPGKGHINAFLDSAFVLPIVESFLQQVAQ